MNDNPKITQEIVETMQSEKSEGKRSKFERVSKALSIVAIPFVLAIGGWYIQTQLQDQSITIQKQLQDQSVRKDYVQIAISILTEPDKTKVDPILRGWAVDLLNDNSPRKFSTEVIEKLKEGKISLPSDGAVVDTTINKSGVIINPSNGEKLRYRMDIIGASSTVRLSCEDRTLWTEMIPISDKERVWFKDQTDFHSNDETYTFNISSSGTTKYNLFVELIGADGKVLDVVKDIKGESTKDDTVQITFDVRVSR